jgi:aminopeptidase N
MISTVAAHPELAFDYAAAHREQVNAKVDTTSLSSRYYPGLANSSLGSGDDRKLKAFAEKHIAASRDRAHRTPQSANIEYRVEGA